MPTIVEVNTKANPAFISIPDSGGGGVTAVTGVAPIASSGGATPAISIAVGSYGFGISTSVKTGNYNAAIGDLVICDPTFAGFNVVLPDATSSANKIITVKNQSDSNNVITILPTGGDTVDGGASAVINQARESLTFVSDGISDWMIV